MEFVQSLLTSPTILNGLLAAGLFILLVALAYAAHYFAQNEKVQKNARLLEMLKETVLNAVMFVAFQDPDLSQYEAKSDAEVEAGHFRYDPRLLYVADKAEDWAKRHGLNIETDDIRHMAESIYQRLKTEGRLDNF